MSAPLLHHTPASHQSDIRSDDKWVFEVCDGVLLALGERIALADGWWFSTNADPFGPFETFQQAIDAAAEVSDPAAKLDILASPQPPLPVTDPGEIFPLKGDAINCVISAARDDELASESSDQELKDQLGVADTERLMVVLYLPEEFREPDDDATPEEEAAAICARLHEPVVVVNEEEVLAFSRPAKSA